MATATKSHAIVSSLYPSNVRDQLMAEVDTDHNKNRGAKNAFLKRDTNNAAASNPENGCFATSESIFGSKPIAELYPATTIMFADLTGFTAWSSVREPQQVFILLETIYHAFDTIAKRRRIFKVETVGDCYVAVCGLPVERKDHATAMARFASECLEKMDSLTKNLEASLG
jgi:hypothetical protein